MSSQNIFFQVYLYYILILSCQTKYYFVMQYYDVFFFNTILFILYITLL